MTSSLAIEITLDSLFLYLEDTKQVINGPIA